jgi:hypothetical protein
MKMNEVWMEFLNYTAEYRMIFQGDSLSGDMEDHPYPVDLYPINDIDAVGMTFTEAHHNNLVTIRVVCQIFTDILHSSYIRGIIL